MDECIVSLSLKSEGTCAPRAPPNLRAWVWFLLPDPWWNFFHFSLATGSWLGVISGEWSAI